MRILTFSRETYPAAHASSFVLLHQSMALEDLGHEVHLYNLARPSLFLGDYLQAYEFDLLYFDARFLSSPRFLQAIHDFRRKEAVRAVAALLSLPPPREHVWEVVDFVVTPWRGKTVDALAGKADVRHLPLGYNDRLHRRSSGRPALGPVFVGNTSGGREQEADAYLAPLIRDRVVLCLGPAFEQNYVDPFALGNVYAAARCLPNFHYPWEKGADMVLNERFWQASRCGIPVHDFSPLMAEVLDQSLMKAFCFTDREAWARRIRAMSSKAALDAGLVARLDAALEGHSYRDRMELLLEWVS